METCSLIISIFLICLCFAYVFVILAFTYGWVRLEKFVLSDKEPKTKVSIIIPARNEEQNITDILYDLLKQSYPKNLFEIIVVDDFSTDNTKNLIKDFINSNPGLKIKLITTESGSPQISGKKQAIKTGLKNSSAELIVTTDADCRVSKNWLSTIIDFYEKKHPKMIVGPVCFLNDNKWFKKLQSLEFLSLIASGAGAIEIGLPIMCNGANLAYQKQAFDEVNGFETKNEFVSGDDVFLLLKIRKKWGSSAINFLKNSDAVAYTGAKKSFREFISQRIRWVSKSSGYTDFSITTTALVVYLFNLGLLAGFVFGLFYYELLPVVLIMFIVKLVIDLPILVGITKFVRRRKLLWNYLPLQIIYVIYISFMGIFGNFLKFEWKGRKN
ncbi:MAG: glycosyltransferase [Bacteroidales bacterium]|jgi:cellulose synthase/poly-beta-1,6-N-acetylglucosamine synthase-like glycosyltransferase|nr:glycosyltransferase [Bacteroidales bacterium]MCK4406879.1 glycosyltransferase [Bacteroidales bacterium]